MRVLGIGYKFQRIIENFFDIKILSKKEYQKLIWVQQLKDEDIVKFRRPYQKEYTEMKYGEVRKMIPMPTICEV